MDDWGYISGVGGIVAHRYWIVDPAPGVTTYIESMSSFQPTGYTLPIQQWFSADRREAWLYTTERPIASSVPHTLPIWEWTFSGTQADAFTIKFETVLEDGTVWLGDSGYYRHFANDGWNYVKDWDGPLRDEAAAETTPELNSLALLMCSTAALVLLRRRWRKD